MIRYQKRFMLRQMVRDGGSIFPTHDLAFIEQGYFTRGHETHAGSRFGVLHIASQYPVTSFRLLRGASRRVLPFAPFRIRALGKIKIPECGGHEFVGMVVDADYPAAFRFQLLGGTVEFVNGLRQRAFIVEGGTELVP